MLQNFPPQTSIMDQASSRYYEPLQNTLNRSSAGWTSHRPIADLYSSSVDKSIGLSRLSKRRRDLSPEEVHEIKKSTIIPQDKSLIPTNNYQKIQGKNFSIVGVEVKEGQPIPEDQFKQTYRRGPLHQQTIYQLQPKGFGSTTALSSPVYLNSASSSQVKNPLRASSPVGPQIQYQTQTVRPQSPPPPQRHNINGHYATTSIPSALKKSRENNFALSRSPTNKRQYKYNLFSALDEAVNSNCTSCGKNELVASHQHHNWQ